MRIIAFILALYVMVLTVIPCIDVPQDNSKHKTEFSQQKQDSHHHSDTDHCSPFCTCNCCSTSVILQEIPCCTECLVSEVAIFNIYLPASFSNPSFFIWQPPKLG